MLQCLVLDLAAQLPHQILPLLLDFKLRGGAFKNLERR
jgi:hypothetical protein